MSQRISLQYSIPLDNLKDEVERLLSSAYGMAHTLGENCNNSSTGAPLTLQTLHEIEEVRTQLANVDFLLNDITGMINGYLDYQVKKRQPAGPEPSLDGGSLAQIDALAQKLEQFKEDNDDTTQGSTS